MDVDREYLAYLGVLVCLITAWSGFWPLLSVVSSVLNRGDYPLIGFINVAGMLVFYRWVLKSNAPVLPLLAFFSIGTGILLFIAYFALPNYSALILPVVTLPSSPRSASSRVTRGCFR